MEQERKKILIVDDSEIDRIALKSILSREFDVLEAKNGSSACGQIATRGSQMDAILLDISMPDVDGFAVLKYIAKKRLDHIPVFLVTAEPTVDNVQRAMQYSVAEFIGKPFQREDVLRRLKAWLYVTLEPDLEPEELEATQAYIADLEKLYQAYFSSYGLSDAHRRVMSDLMRILLTNYNQKQRGHRLSVTGIELVCKSVYFCDIGEMLLPNQQLKPVFGETRLQELQQNHPALGSGLIRLNRAKSCQYFVELCSNMCLHHHERFDGWGYPDGLREQDNSVYNQLCRLVDEFEQARAAAGGSSSLQTVTNLINRMADSDDGMVNPKLSALLKTCEPQITAYFKQRESEAQ